jgi:AICAR transformylase/IMP cyclohydrolase PurH
MSASHKKIKRAILSVTDKTGLVEFARKLLSSQVRPNFKDLDQALREKKAG